MVFQPLSMSQLSTMIHFASILSTLPSLLSRLNAPMRKLLNFSTNKYVSLCVWVCPALLRTACMAAQPQSRHLIQLRGPPRIQRIQ